MLNGYRWLVLLRAAALPFTFSSDWNALLGASRFLWCFFFCVCVRWGWMMQCWAAPAQKKKKRGWVGRGGEFNLDKGGRESYTYLRVCRGRSSGELLFLPLSLSTPSPAAALFINQAFIKQKRLPALPKRCIDNPDTKTKYLPSFTPLPRRGIVHGNGGGEALVLCKGWSGIVNITYHSVAAAFRLLCGRKPSIRRRVGWRCMGWQKRMVGWALPLGEKRKFNCRCSTLRFFLFFFLFSLRARAISRTIV